MSSGSHGDDSKAHMGVLDLEPPTKKQTSKHFISCGWIIFLCVLVIFLIVLIVVLLVLLPKCEREPISIPEPTPTTSIPPTSPRNIWDYPMLPDDIIPLHYFIDLTIDLDNFTFAGNLSVRIRCNADTKLVLLHGRDLTINTQRTTLELAEEDGDSSGKTIDVIDVRLYPENQFILVELGESLEQNAEYLLGMEFDGELRDDLVGLYKSSYTSLQGETRWIAATFFSPTNARKAFPCFDEPGRKANFTFTITHSEAYVALANMDQAGQEQGPSEGWRTTRFHTTPKMSTYIICYAVLDFQYKETVTSTGVRIRAWAREEVIDSVQYGMDLHRDILQYYEEYFDYRFPLPKIDVVALPDFLPGAMENWGLITYRESRLLVVPGVTSSSRQQSTCAIIAHELGHQYFGNLVTHAWWDYMLLKEGFASYSVYISVPHVRPDWDMETQLIVDDLHYVFDSDALASSRPVEVHVETADEVSQLFDAIAYSKGPSILRMCRSFLGEPTFKKGLKIYINRYAFATATNDQLWSSLQQAADEDGLNINVTAVMHTWVLQMGYPVVNITRDYARNDVISFQADQKRFLQDPKANTTTHYDDLGYVWRVPLSFASSSSPGSQLPIVWMENGPAQASITGSTSDWLLVNLDQTGYYRVNYDPENWKLLSQQLVSNYSMIPQINRAALLNDAFNLAKAGEMSQAIALDVTLYLVNETQYVPWEAASDALNYLDIMLSKTGAYGAYQKYMQQQVTPLYNLYGWIDEGTHLEKLTRGEALSIACGYGYPDCMETALGLYRLWMQNGTNNPITADFRSVVYCAAIAAGGQDEWTFAFTQYQNTTIASEKSTLMSAMSCSNQPWILSTYLAYTIDSSKIRSQDTVNVIKAVASNPVGSSLAWDFFRANWDYFRERYGNNIFDFKALIEGVTSFFNTEFHLQQLLDFMATHPDQGTGAVAFKQAVERTQANIRWMEAYLLEVQQWLEEAVIH